MYRSSAAFAIALALTTQLAHVQAQSEAQRTAGARALFDEGMGFVRNEQWEQAADRFRRAYALRPAAPVRLNLALALTHLGHLVEASELFLETAHDASANDAMRQQAQEEADGLRRRIGRLTVNVGSGLSGDVHVDGHVLARELVGVPAPTDPGTHEVSLVQGERTLAHETVVVNEGAASEVTLTANGAATPADSNVQESLRTPPPAHEELTSQWWFWTAIGGGALVLTLIIVGIAAAASSGGGSPVQGNFTPPFLDVTVAMP